jgi:hypothetical protein
MGTAAAFHGTERRVQSSETSIHGDLRYRRFDPRNWSHNLAY